MDKRIIDLSEEAAFLSVKYNQLLLKRGELIDSIPLRDLGVLIVSHPAVYYTHAVLTGLCENGGIFILCDKKRIPSAMLLPLESNSVQSERLNAQTEVQIPTKKRLWTRIVKAKVKSQGHILEKHRGDDKGLYNLAKKVLSGDSGNIEARAARIYWPALFGEKFRRIPGEPSSPNCLLNYGYAVLRGIVARALCSAGLHPSLGLHHHNRYNAFCLADDLMEPFRPLLDEAVILLMQEQGENPPLDKTSKAVLIKSLIEQRFVIKGEARSIFDIARKMASSLAGVYMGKRKNLILPEWQ